MRPTPQRRAAFSHMSEHKAPRRMQLADDVSLLWESRQTIEHQIEQMMEMEDEEESQAAIRTSYAEMMPDADALSATLFIEVRDSAQIKARLRHYAGLEDAIVLKLPGQEVRPQIVGDHASPEAAMAVTYLRFPLPSGADLAAARLVVDHQHLQVDEPLPQAVVDLPA